MDAIEIPIKISGIGRVNREINEVGKRLGNLSQQGSISMGGGGGGGGSGGRGRGSGSGGLSFANGPMQQLVRAQMQFRNAWKFGTGAQKVDAGLALQAAQGRVGKALAVPGVPTPKAPVPNASSPAAKTPQTMGQKVQSAFMSSRVDLASGRIMPLVGKLLDALPTPVRYIVALGAAAKRAADSLNAFRDSQLTTGGTGEQTALLRAMGISPGLARSFGQRIASDPMAAGFAARAGIYNPGGEIFGDINTATNLLKMAEALRKMPQADALRAARITGTEDLLKYRDISEQTFRRLGEDAKQTAQIHNPQAVRAAAEFNVQMGRVQSAFHDLGVQLGTYVLPIIAKGAEILAYAIRGWNEILNFFFGGMNDPTGKKNPQIEALNANTASLRELGTILKNGTYGGGDRARGAVPAGWTGMWYDKWSRNAIGLGAFEL